MGIANLLDDRGIAKGLIPFKISYCAERIRSDSGISYEITGITFTKALMVYRFEAIDENVTQVTWRVDVDSKLPIEGWLATKMLKPQNVLIGRLNRVELGGNDAIKKYDERAMVGGIDY